MAEITIPIIIDIQNNIAELAAHVLTIWLNRDASRGITLLLDKDRSQMVVLTRKEEV